MNELARVPPRPPAQIADIVEILGPDLTATFLLRFGGAELYMAEDPKGRSQVEALVGTDRARSLATLTNRQRRVPLAKPWGASHLRFKGATIAEIARTPHVTDITVRRYLK